MPVNWVVYCYAEPPTRLLRQDYSNSVCNLPKDHDGPHRDSQVTSISVHGVWFTDKEIYPIH
jgi:hypothetical protein